MVQDFTGVPLRVYAFLESQSQVSCYEMVIFLSYLVVTYPIERIASDPPPEEICDAQALSVGYGVAYKKNKTFEIAHETPVELFVAQVMKLSLKTKSFHHQMISAFIVVRGGGGWIGEGGLGLCQGVRDNSVHLSIYIIVFTQFVKELNSVSQLVFVTYIFLYLFYHHSLFPS